MRVTNFSLTTPIYYTQLDGFDTHANQPARHPGLLRELGESARAFLDDLEKAGEADRVLLLVFSEFGRRPAENASAEPVINLWSTGNELAPMRYSAAPIGHIIEKARLMSSRPRADQPPALISEVIDTASSGL